MAFTGIRVGSLIRFTNLTRPEGPPGSSGPGASFVPHAAPTRANAAINPIDLVVIVFLASSVGAAGWETRRLCRIRRYVRVGVSIAECVGQPAALTLIGNSRCRDGAEDVIPPACIFSLH